MFKPVSLQLTWADPVPAIDLMAPKDSSSGANYPGLYLHVISGTSGDIATYVGKSEHSIGDRQVEHLESYRAGKYHIYDASGHVVHGAFVAPADNHDTLVADLVARTRIYAAKVTTAHHNSLILEYAESLLLHSPVRLKSSLININMSAGSAGFQSIDNFTILHGGNPDPQKFFGPRTVWDRANKTFE